MYYYFVTLCLLLHIVMGIFILYRTAVMVNKDEYIEILDKVN